MDRKDLTPGLSSSYTRETIYILDSYMGDYYERIFNFYDPAFSFLTKIIYQGYVQDLISYLPHIFRYTYKVSSIVVLASVIVVSI